MTKLFLLVAVATFTFVFQTYAQSINPASLRSEKIKVAVEYLSACGNFIR